MSVSLHYTTIVNPCLVDIVDDEWAAEKLPDDDIPLPVGFVPPGEENEEDQIGAPKAAEKWLDLGLQSLR
eukprot:jgi/Botrbrau1/12978/Bobra.384_1s0004.1